jgi:ABC-2 type transport system ATP-binding protein
MTTTIQTPGSERRETLAAWDLVKSYPGGRGKPRLQALSGVTFRAEPGTIFGLLGPNGAGKSTTVKILSTLTRADSGRAVVGGVDVTRHPDQVRRVIGFVAQKQVSDPMDTGLENLVLAGQLHGMSARSARIRAGELLERFSLTSAARRQVKTYSGGMARKLDVAIGLMHRPAVLFLDEPTTGLDPEARAGMWAELESMANDEQMTVLLTTHYLEEADRLARTLAIIDHGTVIATGTPDELKNDLHGDSIVVELLDAGNTGPAVRSLGALAGISELSGEGRTLRARADTGASALPQVLAFLEQADIPVASATVARPSLDDVYFRHTGATFAAKENAA